MSQANLVKTPIAPLLLDRDGIYPQEWIVEAFGVAKATLAKWHARGLKRLRPGTLKVYYLGADLVTFFASLPDAGEDED